MAQNTRRGTSAATASNESTSNPCTSTMTPTYGTSHDVEQTSSVIALLTHPVVETMTTDQLATVKAESSSLLSLSDPDEQHDYACSWRGGRLLFGACCLLIVSGCSLGIWVAPKNPSLPTPWYRTVSAMLGYTYFLCWSVSFYPQVILNCQRKSTQGLSPDFCLLNVLGFACYASYTLSLYFSDTLQHQYELRHDGAHVTVQTNDVAFAVHALLLSLVTLLQIGYYDGFRVQQPSIFIQYFIVGTCVICILFPIFIYVVSWSTWLDYVYMLSYVKILISIIKYVPQVILNYQRKSTIGWSIGNILLDLSGGLLSDLQLILDSLDGGNLYAGITGNLAKLGLGLISIGFDIVFLWQHYILYPQSSPYVQL